MAWLDSNKKLCTLKFQIQKILTFFNIKKRATNLGLLYAIYPNIYIYLYLVSVEGEKGGERVSVTRQDLIVAESKVSGGQSRCIYIDWFSSMKYYIYIYVCAFIYLILLLSCVYESRSLLEKGKRSLATRHSGSNIWSVPRNRSISVGALDSYSRCNIDLDSVILGRLRGAQVAGDGPTRSSSDAPGRSSRTTGILKERRRRTGRSWQEDVDWGDVDKWERESFAGSEGITEDEPAVDGMTVAINSIACKPLAPIH